MQNFLKNIQALPYIFLLGLLFGSNTVAARFAIGQMAPNVFNSIRLVIVLGCFTLVYALSKNRSWPKDKKLWLHAGVWGVIGLAVPMASFITSLKYQSSGVTTLLVTLNVGVTIILAHFFLRDEPLTPKTILGLVIAFAGAGLILIQGETGLSEFKQADWRGYALVAAGVIGSSVGLVYARKFLHNNDPFQVVSVRMVAAALVLIPFTLVTDGFDLSGVRLSGLGILIFSSLIGTYVTFQLEFLIVKRFSASATSQASYVSPVVAGLLGALLLGEKITATLLIGMVTIFIGISLLHNRKRQKANPKKPLMPKAAQQETDPVTAGKTAQQGRERIS
jgi:drug/metabolite transporter (DMT)-like permease